MGLGTSVQLQTQCLSPVCCLQSLDLIFDARQKKAERQTQRKADRLAVKQAKEAEAKKAAKQAKEEEARQAVNKAKAAEEPENPFLPKSTNGRQKGIAGKEPARKSTDHLFASCMHPVSQAFTKTEVVEMGITETLSCH